MIALRAACNADVINAAHDLQIVFELVGRIEAPDPTFVNGLVLRCPLHHISVCTLL